MATNEPCSIGSLRKPLTNVARHAGATEAVVNISKLDGSVVMSIKDNGKGFHTNGLSRGKKSKRLGLLGMRERVEMIGGSFAVESVPGQGTTIQARDPARRCGAGGASRGVQ